MKFRAPPDCRAVFLGGAAIAVSPDGTIEAEEASVTLLLPHEFVPFEADMAVFEDPDHRRLLARVPAMSKPLLIAMLREAGVAGPLPRTVRGLRAALRRVLGARRAA